MIIETLQIGAGALLLCSPMWGRICCRDGLTIGQHPRNVGSVNMRMFYGVGSRSTAAAGRR